MADPGLAGRPRRPDHPTGVGGRRGCHRALGCRDYSLFDFRIDPEGQPWFLEAGLYCSYAPSSVIAVMAAAIGLDVADLFAMGLAELSREGAQCLTSPH